MLVESIITCAAEFLGLREVIDRMLDNEVEDGDAEIFDRFMRAYNFVETELATDYLPIENEEPLTVENGKGLYKKLTSSPLYIIDVLDKRGQKVDFKVYPTYFSADDGEYTVRYAITPRLKKFDDDCECSTRATMRLLSYGVAAEYCAIMGLYAEQAVWEKKYKEAVAAACRTRGAKFIKDRKWV